jgi:hypothetical protein
MWDTWWTELVLSADLAWQECPVVQRPVEPLLAAVVSQEPPPEIVLVQLVSSSGVADGGGLNQDDQNLLPDLESGDPLQLAVPVVAVLRAGALEVSEKFESVEIGDPVEEPCPAGQMVETRSAVYLEDDLTAIAWHYALKSSTIASMTISFLSNGFEIIDDIGADVAASAGSLVVVPRSRSVIHER